MKYYNKTDAENLTRKEIENIKQAISLYPQIIEAVEKFDGKVLNKRFQTALQKVDSNIYVDMSGSTLYIEYSCWNNRTVKSVKTDSLGYSNTLYIRNDKISLNGYLRRVCGYPTTDILCTEENRLIASVVIDALNKHKTYLEEKAERLENSLKTVEENKIRLEELRKEMEEITHDIPWEIREYFDMGYRVAID